MKNKLSGKANHAIISEIIAEPSRNESEQNQVAHSVGFVVWIQWKRVEWCVLGVIRNRQLVISSRYKRQALAEPSRRISGRDRDCPGGRTANDADVLLCDFIAGDGDEIENGKQIKSRTRLRRAQSELISPWVTSLRIAGRRLALSFVNRK